MKNSRPRGSRLRRNVRTAVDDRPVMGMTLSRSTVQSAVDLGLLPSADALPGSLPDEEITAVLDGRQYLDTKVAALRAHRS